MAKVSLPAGNGCKAYHSGEAPAIGEDCFLATLWRLCRAFRSEAGTNCREPKQIAWWQGTVRQVSADKGRFADVRQQQRIDRIAVGKRAHMPSGRNGLRAR